LERSVTLERRPERVVSLNPATTETIFALGAGARIVAVTSVDNFPPEVKNLPQVGGFLPLTVSVEAIVAQQPDLVVCDGKLHRSLVDAMTPLGLTVLALEGITLEQLIDNVRLVGRVMGEEEKGKALAADLAARAEKVRQQGAALPREKRPKVFYLQWDDPLRTAGPSSFIGQIIQDAGGDNIFADTQAFFPLVNGEEVIRRNPDLILIPTGAAAEAFKERVSTRPGWAELAAVKAGHVAFINEDVVSRPGPRLIQGMEEVARAIQRRVSGEW
jgi:iron complex transport system substrate-binding protein